MKRHGPRKDAGGREPAPGLANCEANGSRRRTRSTRAELNVRGTISVPRTIMKWERDVLLPFALEALTDFVESTDHATSNDEKKSE